MDELRPGNEQGKGSQRSPRHGAKLRIFLDTMSVVCGDFKLRALGICRNPEPTSKPLIIDEHIERVADRHANMANRKLDRPRLIKERPEPVWRSDLAVR